MKILSIKPGHDGTFALVEDGALQFSFEAEKDNYPRYHPLGAADFVDVAQHMEALPDIVALSGWHDDNCAGTAGYHGVSADTSTARTMRFFGTDAQFFSSTHERAHIMNAYAMSPWPQGEPCYALVYEGIIGAFYEISKELTITPLGTPLSQPGRRYVFPFWLAATDLGAKFSNPSSLAGKTMALAAYSNGSAPSKHEQKVIDFIMREPLPEVVLRKDCNWMGLSRIGHEEPAVRELIGKLSDTIFQRFYDFASSEMNKGYPLLISGGCGLNCEWNTRWRDCGLFSDVFVPPCANDSGCAIGTAADAQFHWTGNAKLDWSVYSGLTFLEDCEAGHLNASPLDCDEVAALLEAGNVVAWVNGRSETGPRALGNRSLLASPFSSAMSARLNRIKHREAYRPVAPVCLEEDMPRHFDSAAPSRYMLHFQRVVDPALCAVTHVDNSARAQTVTRSQNEALYELLLAFRRRTGCGVLCNTSLNFPGRGFINRMSDLLRFKKETGIEVLVVNGRVYR